ncbi:Metallo-dependent phosphatase, partial [Pleomassaria siparia CBS 279.74]
FRPASPTTWDKIRDNGLIFMLTDYLYNMHQWNIATRPPLSAHDPIITVCISDTHCSTPANIPHGDILLHAGDLTKNGTFEELQKQLSWLNSLPHAHKIAIAGNHDVLLDASFLHSCPSRLRPPAPDQTAAHLDWGSIVYLQNSSTTVTVRGRQINIFGCPMTPKYGNWAFQFPRQRDVWTNTVPRDTDVLLCHGPPMGHLDRNRQGCAFLSREIERVRPRLCVFGHIHEGRGRRDVEPGFVQRCYDGVVRGD